MKPILACRPAGLRLPQMLVGILGAALSWSASGADVINSNFSLTITPAQQHVVLSWFGSNSISYQVESSSNLITWIDTGSILVGAGTILFTTNPVAGHEPTFYRVKHAAFGPIASAVFDPGTGVLTIIGTDQANLIVVSRDAGGYLRINDGAVSITGGIPTVANTTLIQIFGRDGNDLLSLDETNGALPKANLFGEGGNDTLNGGSGNDVLNGGPGNDVLSGRGGADSLIGGDDNDTVVGGDGDDAVQLGAGDDRFIWNPGDDTDVVDGGDGSDIVEVNAGNGAEDFTVTANGTRVRFDRLDPAPFFLDIGTCEDLVLHANGGNDTLACTGNLAALIKITADAGPGNDTLRGSNGADVLLGGDGDDFIDGQQGNDVIFLGGDNDTVQWDPGDGNDTIEGQGGNDRLNFNGSAGSEIFEISANGGRVRFTRNIGNIVMDLDDVHVLELNALAGTDTVIVNDLAATDLTSVSINLAGTLGGSVGDAAADVVIVNGSNGPDIIDVVGAGTSVTVLGLSAEVNITNSEGANDALAINALAGDDGVTATTLPAGVIKLTIDGGADDDTLLGSQGADVFLGGDGDDFVFGDNGDDLALLGDHDDVFQWDPGDGNDIIEGQGGVDTLLFFGSNAVENIDVFSNGGRVLFFRSVGSVTMDLDDVENIDFRALGGADNIVVGDLSGTDVAGIDLDLRGPNGDGDAAADTVTVNGTNGDDVFGAKSASGEIEVFGLQAVVKIFSTDPAGDRLTLNALGGNDVIDATLLDAVGIQLTLNGGLGNDILLGGAGDDLIAGGDGNDTALMGAGNDSFVWNPGDDNDTIEGQAGLDRLLFSGANVAENITVFSNGGRVLFFRDVASVTMDLNDTETLVFNALGGADNISIQDLSGTDILTVDLNLSSSGGAGDGAIDTVSVAGTATNDVILVSGNADGTSVLGLPAQVNIIGAEAANDRLIINALAGDDVVDAMALETGAIQFTADGGVGDDILLGGVGADTLSGGDHDDVILGGPGLDLLDGGTGDNVVIQDGPAAGSNNIVTMFGDNTDNAITISRDAGGNILSNGVAIPGATVANTAFIRVFGLAGQDTLALNESNGALPAALLYGGAGNDTLNGGTSADFLFGGSNNDTLLGRGGVDFLFGGADGDTLTGGDANDLAFGQAGNDRFVWNPGDDTDLNEGGLGTDTVEVNGGNGAEQFTATSNGTRVRFDRLDPAPFSIDIGACENLVLNANGGDDRFSATGNLAALIQITVDGGAGNDTILGSNGADLLLGGADNDFIDGQQGNDVVFLGAGDDVFQWDPGDGSDTVEGQDGNDNLIFNGSAGAETFEAAPNGTRMRFTRNLGNILMDLDGIETLDLRALGGTDFFIVQDLTGTSLTSVLANLAGTLGGTNGDAAVDNVIVNTTAGEDVVFVADSAGLVQVLGLSALVNIFNSEPANDRLTINTLASDDVVDASGLADGIILLTADGGDDNDVLIGSDGPDTLLGGNGDDVLMGGPGLDVLDGGPGDNIIIQ